MATRNSLNVKAFITSKGHFQSPPYDLHHGPTEAGRIVTTVDGADVVGATTADANAEEDAEDVRTTVGFVDPAAVTGKAKSPGPVSAAAPPVPAFAVNEAPSPYK